MFPAFFKPASDKPAAEAPKAPEGNVPSADPALAPKIDPNAIPDKADLAFFNSLIKDATATTDKPANPISVVNDILTPDNIKKIAASQNFAASIPPETLQKLQEGDSAAMMSAVEAMATAAYTTALSQTGTIVDTVLNQREGISANRVRKDILDSLSVKEVTGAIPGIENPVVKSMAEMISTNLATQFPQASPSQIRNMTQQYFAEVNNAMNPSEAKPETNKPEETDWMAYAGFQGS